ncbi:MAG: hypothetical protein PHU85_00160 [Phycisphaerae bacterium]|nr:hypothetical protein [Phycisphaerae bacterium]
MSLRQEMLAAVASHNEFKPIAVPTPGWPELDGRIFVMPPTAAEKSAINQERADHPENPNAYARWVVRCACDKEGKPAFYDKKTYEEDVEALGRDITGTVDAIAEAIFERAALTRGAQEKLEKNSETTRTCSLPTSSPGTSASPTSTDCSPGSVAGSSSAGGSSTA